MKTIESLEFQNVVLRELPIDPNEENFTRQVSGACFSRVKPSPIREPRVVVVSDDALKLVDLSPDEAADPKFAEYAAGCKVIPGSETAAHCYCGHQFGAFSGQLGDGATMFIGQVRNEKGELWEIQYKGAGRTPYSRGSDGRKVLRSSLREFLCSEAMHYLGIPTTRALSCVTSYESKIVRDIHYDGNAKEEPTAVIIRIAPTFLRFGSFEICKPEDPVTGRQGPSAGNTEPLKRLIDHVLKHYYPECEGETVEERIQKMFRKVVHSTAYLVARWQCVGWCHGVLNTDNMSVLGLTIDYGPFGWMDWFDRGYICNASDGSGRYSYEKQPSICKWNLERFADALRMAYGKVELGDEVAKYDETYRRLYYHMIASRLGLVRDEGEPTLPDEGVRQLVDSFFDTLQATNADMLGSLRELSSEAPSLDAMVAQCPTPSQLEGYISKQMKILRMKIPPQQLVQMVMMFESRPELIGAMFGGANPEHVFQELKEEMAKLDKNQTYHELREALRAMTAEEKAKADREKWSAWLDTYLAARGKDAWVVPQMRGLNPAFVLRQWIAQVAIDAAEKQDFARVRKIFERLKHPYDNDPDFDREFARLPEWADNLAVT